MVQLTQQFEFSAAHRLHNSELSEQENRDLFGKCNNPHGHGHNYLVTISIEGAAEEKQPFGSLGQFETLVKKEVIDRLDHRHLNVEVSEFKELNPTVENIAMVIWDYLEKPILELKSGVRLSNVRVHETAKTWADFCRR